MLEAERILLLERGHEIRLFSRHSDEIRNQGVWGVLRGAFATPWNPWMTQQVKQVVNRFMPDVVHVHNTFPLISPGIFHAIGNKAARVLTLHNYRLFCPAGIPMRASEICTACLDAKSALPALQYGCYRGSRVATLPLAMSVDLHRALGTWSKQVDAFICLSAFQRDLMVACGLPFSKAHIKPNFYPGVPSVRPWKERSPCVVFVGRLTAEKGVSTLLCAWRLWGADAPELRLIGDGTLRAELEKLGKGLPVRFLGQIASAEAQAEIARARLLVLPSECFEGFPMVIREAFAFGTPAAVSDIGPLPSIVEHGTSGVVYAPRDPEALLRQVRALWITPGLLEKLGNGARKQFESKYTEQVNYKMLMGIYQDAIAVSRSSVG